MPTPRPNETRQEWMERCVPELIEEGRNQDQATAICYSMYREREKK